MEVLKDLALVVAGMLFVYFWGYERRWNVMERNMKRMVKGGLKFHRENLRLHSLFRAALVIAMSGGGQEEVRRMMGKLPKVDEDELWDERGEIKYDRVFDEDDMRKLGEILESHG